MGREIRKVHKDWQHPTDENGNFTPLHNSKFSEALAKWEQARRNWEPDPEHPDYTFEADYGKRPVPERYMPEWSDDEATHLMMYENVSEGTPLSPAFETQEELARWLVDNKADAGAGKTASYDEWLAMIKRGSSPSFAVINGMVTSGVALMAQREREQQASNDQTSNDALVAVVEVDGVVEGVYWGASCDYGGSLDGSLTVYNKDGLQVATINGDDCEDTLNDGLAGYTPGSLFFRLAAALTKATGRTVGASEAFWIMAEGIGTEMEDPDDSVSAGGCCYFRCPQPTRVSVYERPNRNGDGCSFVGVGVIDSELRRAAERALDRFADELERIAPIDSRLEAAIDYLRGRLPA